MFFKKKTPVADPVVPEAPASEKPETWGEREHAIMTGYVKKAFRCWNRNRPAYAISEEDLAHLLTGLSWAIREMTPEEAYKFNEENERS